MARQRLVDTQGTEFHEDVDDLLFLRQLVDPGDVLVGHQGVLAPFRVREAQADVV